jgi:hypothetical protein
MHITLRPAHKLKKLIADFSDTKSGKMDMKSLAENYINLWLSQLIMTKVLSMDGFSYVRCHIPFEIINAGEIDIFYELCSGALQPLGYEVSSTGEDKKIMIVSWK